MARTHIPGVGNSQHLAISLLRNGPWASLSTETVELLAAGGRLSDISAGAIVYTEAEAERFGVVVRGLLRVYMHTSDGRQVTRVKRLVHADAAVAWSFAEESVHRLYDVLEELAGNTFATVRQRVVRHLLDLAASSPASDGRLTALVSQQNLANSVGSVREVVARVLHELRAASLVRTSPGRVEILDPLKMSLELWSRTA